MSPYQHGKFSSSAPKAPAKEHLGSSQRPGYSPIKKPEHGGDMPHGDAQEKHVTVTHPGQTQPHPVTGVHAVHIHHNGDGKYTIHTHHDGGEVETRQHPSHEDMQAHVNGALPPDGQGNSNPLNPQDDFSAEMGGVGGTDSGTGGGGGTGGGYG